GAAAGHGGACRSHRELDQPRVDRRVTAELGAGLVSAQERLLSQGLSGIVLAQAGQQHAIGAPLMKRDQRVEVRGGCRCATAPNCEIPGDAQGCTHAYGGMDERAANGFTRYEKMRLPGMESAGAAGERLAAPEGRVERPYAEGQRGRT